MTEQSETLMQEDLLRPGKITTVYGAPDVSQLVAAICRAAWTDGIFLKRRVAAAGTLVVADNLQTTRIMLTPRPAVTPRAWFVEASWHSGKRSITPQDLIPELEEHGADLLILDYFGVVMEVVGHDEQIANGFDILFARLPQARVVATHPFRTLSFKQHAIHSDDLYLCGGTKRVNQGVREGPSPLFRHHGRSLHYGHGANGKWIGIEGEPTKYYINSQFGVVREQQNTGHRATGRASVSGSARRF